MICINEADHINSVRLMLEKLRKYLLYINLKKYKFHQDQVQFLDYVVSLQGICIEDEQIKAVCD